MAKKIKRGIGIIFVFLLFVFATGCGLIGKDDSGSGSDFERGASGLVMEFVPNYPGNSYIVSEGINEPILIMIDVKNKGTFPEDGNFEKGQIHISGFDDRIINMSGGGLEGIAGTGGAVVLVTGAAVGDPSCAAKCQGSYNNGVCTDTALSDECRDTTWFDYTQLSKSGTDCSLNYCYCYDYTPCGSGCTGCPGGCSEGSCAATAEDPSCAAKCQSEGFTTGYCNDYSYSDGCNPINDKWYDYDTSDTSPSGTTCTSSKCTCVTSSDCSTGCTGCPGGCSEGSCAATAEEEEVVEDVVVAEEEGEVVVEEEVDAEEDAVEEVSGVEEAAAEEFFEDVDRVTGKSKSLASSDVYLPAASPINPLGGFSTIEFEGQIVASKMTIDEYNPTILATACYPYATKASPVVCIDPQPFDDRQEKVCNIGSQTLSAQGAPIAVTRIDQEASTGKIQFKISIGNVGIGDVLKPDSGGSSVILDKCNPLAGGPLDRRDFDRVRLTKLEIGGNDLLGAGKCSPFADGTGDEDIKLIRLFNGEGFVICTLDVSAGVSSAYTTPLDIKFDYNYRSTISKSIRISKLTGVS